MEGWEYHMQDKTYYKIREFNGTPYRIEMFVEQYTKSFRIWTGASSGKKRKDLDIFEDNDAERLGGIKALVWVKEQMLAFGEQFMVYYHEGYLGTYKYYLCVRWVDVKRRDIYHRSLSREGFRYAHVEHERILMKRIG